MRDGLYYEFLSINNQLIELDYPLQAELFAIIEDDKGTDIIQKYVFIGQFTDNGEIWYILNAVENGKVCRHYILKENNAWHRSEAEARKCLWEQKAKRVGVK